MTAFVTHTNHYRAQRYIRLNSGSISLNPNFHKTQFLVGIYLTVLPRLAQQCVISLVSEMQGCYRPRQMCIQILGTKFNTAVLLLGTCYSLPWLCLH